jgi:hypothetical protein
VREDGQLVTIDRPFDWIEKEIREIEAKCAAMEEEKKK